ATVDMQAGSWKASEAVALPPVPAAAGDPPLPAPPLPAAPAVPVVPAAGGDPPLPMLSGLRWPPHASSNPPIKTAIPTHAPLAPAPRMFPRVAGKGPDGSASCTRSVRLGRRDQLLQVEKLGEAQVRHEGVALLPRSPEGEAEAVDGLRAYIRGEDQAIGRDHEERCGVQPPFVDENRRAAIQERLDGAALQGEVGVAGESDAGREVQLTAEPGLDLVQ